MTEFIETIDAYRNGLDESAVPDGTPMSDILAHNRELAAQVADLKRRLRGIRSLVGSGPLSAWTGLRRQQVIDYAKF